MDAKTIVMLKAKGWRVGSTREFLGATVAMERFVDTRLNLRHAMIETRKAKGWTQERLAAAMGTTQSRVAQIEGGDPSTSTDLLLRALYAMDLTRDEVGAAVALKLIDAGETDAYALDVQRAASVTSGCGAESAGRQTAVRHRKAAKHGRRIVIVGERTRAKTAKTRARGGRKVTKI